MIVPLVIKYYGQIVTVLDLKSSSNATKNWIPIILMEFAPVKNHAPKNLHVPILAPNYVIVESVLRNVML